MLPSNFDFQNEFNISGLPSPALDEIEKALKTREAVNSKMEQAFSLIMESMALAPSYTFESFLSNASWYRGIGVNNLAKEAEKALDKKLWLSLLEKSRLGVLMNSQQYEEIYNQIQTNPLPLTREAATGTFIRLFEQRQQTFLEGFVEVFKGLSKNYKSHSAFKVQSRMILENTYCHGYIGRSSYNGNRFRDMWRYLYLLQGIDPSSLPVEETPDQIINDLQDDSGLISFRGFSVRLYRGNGNIHIFIDKDLLKQVNNLIAVCYKDKLPEA